MPFETANLTCCLDLIQFMSSVFVHLFLIVPDGAASVLLQSGVVATSASVRADMIPHLRTWTDVFTTMFKNYAYLKSNISVFYHPSYLLLLHSNQGDGQTHSASFKAIN